MPANARVETRGLMSDAELAFWVEVGVDSGNV